MLPKYHKLMGHNVAVIASLVSFDKDGKTVLIQKAQNYISNDGYRVIRLNYKKIFYGFNKILRRYEKTFDSIVNENPDIIFTHGCQFWDIKFVIKFKLQNKSTKIYVDNHADFHNSAKTWISRNILHKIIWRFCAKSVEPVAEKFFGVTPLRCDFLSDVYGIAKNKIELLVMGADDVTIDKIRIKSSKSDLRKALNLSEDDFILITGGKIDSKKNIHLLLNAVNELNNHNIKLIIFGTFIPREIIKLDELINSDKIRYIGWINSIDIYKYFIASDLSVFPGTHSVLWEESIGSGLPGIFKYWKGIDHIDLGGNIKFIFDDKPDEIKKIIEEILNDNSIYSKMKNAAESKGTKTFSYTEIAKESIQTVT